MKTVLRFILATVLTVQYVFAVPAYPGLVNYNLPDGSEITIQLRGDEWTNWAETPDGFTILVNSEGFFEYAVQNQNQDLELSGIRARDEFQRTAEDQLFLNNLQKQLRFSSYQIETKLEFRRTKENFMRGLENDDSFENDKPRKTVGIVRLPVVLIGFANRPFTRTKEEIELLFNQPNYTVGGLTGSLRDYYYDISHGQLDIAVDIFGPFHLSEDVGHYSNDCPGGDSRRMARAAVDSAFAHGADFSTFYLNPGTNNLSAIHIIFAGYCQAAGAVRCQSIWSHAWSMPTVVHNDVRISRFSTSPELRGRTGNNLFHIGTLAHELGHALLGLPDFYDTDYNGSMHLGNWCLMASAGGIDGGRTPGNISAWGRVRAGWIQEVVLHYPTNITLPNPNATDAVYRINTQTPNEYFLIENRTTASKWDTGIPSSGMLIYHVDMNNPGWNNNCVNCNPARRGNYIKQAGGNAGSTSGNRTADPWPQPHMGRTEYTDWSTPDSKSWAGANTNKPITNIIRDAEEGTVSFDILGGPTDYFIFLSENQVIFQNPGINYDEVTPQTITITNFGTSPTGELSITLTGENPNSFTASPTTIPSIEIDGNGSFTIVPNVGLDFGTYTATVTVGNDNVSESFSVVFEVAKLEGANVSTPTLADITFNSITVNSIDEPANGQTVEYTISTGQVIDETIMDWQVETTFTGLNSRTNYFVFARSAENEFFFAGRTSISTRFLTLFNSSDISDIEIETSLKVFPNPVTNGELKIENGEWKSGDIVEIYNLIEKRVYSKQISFTIHHSPLIINISHLPNGMYIVKIGKFSSRIIKQ